jgi:16S rRNA (guanine(527)-N(7))-methyltransferase RsmG
MNTAFLRSLESNSPLFDLKIEDLAAQRLVSYYELIQQHNELLHLVAPCSPEEFAVRHILESLTLLPHLPHKAGLIDVGTGAGLPSIPCLLVRQELRAQLIESTVKKANFLNEAAAALELRSRTEIVNRQFEEAVPHGQFVTCRALDKFSTKLPKLLKWSGKRTLLLFGGQSLAEGLQAHGLTFKAQLMPLSERRFLFKVER